LFSHLDLWNASILLKLFCMKTPLTNLGADLKEPYAVAHTPPAVDTLPGLPQRGKLGKIFLTVYNIIDSILEW